MPKYTYKCNECENKFDVEASIKEKEEDSDKDSNKFNCPKCKSKHTKQVFSLMSFFSSDKGGDKGKGCCCKGKCE